jgi:hypothetical protein
MKVKCMNNFKSTLIVFGAILTISGLTVSQVFAAQDQNQDKNTGTQEQSQEQKLKVTCKVGAYGQASECYAEGDQKQYQKQVLGAGTQIAYKDTNGRHQMVDTALDAQTMLAATTVLLAGAGAYALKRKIA